MPGLSGLSGLSGASGVFSGAAFSPLDISGLQLWLDASDLTTLWQDAGITPVASDGDVVGRWDDKSGNGRNVSQTTTIKKPLYKTSIQNGLPVIRFDGADDWMFSAAVGISPRAYSAFLVYTNMTLDGSWQETLGLDFAPGLQNPTYWSVNIAWGVGGSINKPFSSMRGNVGFNNAIAANVSPSSRILAGIFDIDGTEDELFANNSSLGTDSTNNNTSAFTSTKFFYIGSNAGGTNNTEADLAEILIYSAAMDATQRTQIFDYLNGRWAIY